MHVDGERHATNGVGVRATFAKIIRVELVKSCQAAPFTHADLLGGGNDADVLPHAAEHRSPINQLVQFASGGSVAAVTSRTSMPFTPYSWLAIRMHKSSRTGNSEGLA